MIQFELAAVIVCHIKYHLKYKTLLVNYPFPLTDLHQKTTGLENSTIQGWMQKIIWFCLNLRVLSFAIKNTLVKIINVAGKLPLSLYRYSPKTIGLEYSTNQGCMQKIIWFCLNLRLLSFAIENTLLKHKTLLVNYPFPLTDLH